MGVDTFNGYNTVYSGQLVDDGLTGFRVESVGDTATLDGTVAPGSTTFHVSLDMSGASYSGSATAIGDARGYQPGLGLLVYSVQQSGSTRYFYSSAYSVAQYTLLLADTSFGNFNPACYLGGTGIAVPGGEVAVETLRRGDRVVTARGEARDVRWVGCRSYGGRFLAANPGLAPIRFEAGSLGGGLPRRALWVSPNHAMVLDDHLIRAEMLVNDVTIVRERALRQVDYYHVELDTHDVILAEGAPSETYLDDDNRGVFHNAHEFAALGLVADDRTQRFCAPHLESGAGLEVIRARLHAIAQEVDGKAMMAGTGPAITQATR